MLLKKIILMLFTLSIFSIFGETNSTLSDRSFLDDNYKNSSQYFFAEGEIVYNDKITPFQIYKEQNKFNFYNLSINIDNKIYKIVANKTTNLFYIDRKKVTGDSFFFECPVPLDVFNNALRDRDYLLIDKASRYRYKNIKSNRISVTNHIPEPLVIIAPESKVLQVSNITEEELVLDQTTEPVLELETETTIEPVPEIEKSNIVPNIYPQIIYTISESTPVILKKEFYITKQSRIPAYIYDTNTINFVKGNYIATEWTLTNTKSDGIILFRYNIQSMIYNKQDISKEFSSMTSFYGVK